MGQCLFTYTATPSPAPFLRSFQLRWKPAISISLSRISLCTCVSLIPIIWACPKFYRERNSSKLALWHTKPQMFLWSNFNPCVCSNSSNFLEVIVAVLSKFSGPGFRETSPLRRIIMTNIYCLIPHWLRNELVFLLLERYGYPMVLVEPSPLPG